MFDSPLVRKLIDLAIEEDLALGDITSQLTVPEHHTSKAKVIARQSLVVCGLDIVSEIVRAGGWTISVSTKAEDGASAKEGDVLVELGGRTRDLLSAERTILNFLQRLCGVATYTRKFCEGQSGLKILDTRKTMPGWRLLDKYATRIGGASNHRFSLGDMVLVKNNHIDAHPEGIQGALADVVGKKPLYMPWEVEVRNLEELKVALSFHPTIVMLDNFNDDLLKEAVALIKVVTQPPMIEVSGGVSQDRLAKIHAAGVDAASVGALTTQAPNVDISMRIF
jgi:nicotinate-nucleotide pyrophosphorylase (carboxylating)